jgi:hypothetical protein
LRLIVVHKEGEEDGEGGEGEEDEEGREVILKG